MTRLVVNGFAGPGGWCTGLRLAGYQGDDLGIELDAKACATGHAAGHTRVRADVATFPLGQLVGKVDGAILSPPCPTFSTAGGGAGKVDAPNVYRLIADYAAGRAPGDYDFADPRSALTAQPMRYVAALRPRWAALEQVPPVLPIWEFIAEMLRNLGYHVWCGILTAEEYGVPQTRRRAILMASLDGQVYKPAPTHQRYVAGRTVDLEPGLFGDPLPPPVSMAQALGWDARSLVGFPRRADTKSNGVDGADARVIELNGTRYRSRDLRDAGQPALALTEKVRSWERWTLRNGNQANACARTLDQPAGTIYFGQRANAVDWRGEDTSVRVSVPEAAVLQSFPADYPWQGSKTQQYRQIGDAVPPLLAAAVLRPLLAMSGALPRRAAA